MSTISVDYDVLNQRGSPAWFTDTFANIPTAGYVGRMFISKDTFAFYRDTGTGWDLIGGPGIGTLTGSGVVGQVSFFNGTQVLTGSNNLFWDNINARLGINTTTPGQALDVHGTANTLVQLNNSTTGNSNIAFQNQDVAKWRIGNVYNAGANNFDIQNATTSTTLLTISSNLISFPLGVAAVGGIGFPSSVGGSNYGGISGSASFFQIAAQNGSVILIKSSDNTNALTISTTGNVNFGNTIGNGTYTYTLPSATGTLALTSNLSSYLPLTGGTLTGALVINPTNTLTIGLDVASNTTRFRSDNLEGFKRQLEITMGSGTLVQLTAKGYLANYGTDMAFYTATTGGTNASPGIYITGTNNRVGIKTGTPAYDLDVTGTFGVSSTSVFSNSINVTGTDNNNLITSTSTTGAGGTLRMQANEAASYIVSNNARPLYIQTNSSTAISIASGGNVGIANPPASDVRLYVQSATTSSASFGLGVHNGTSNLLLVRGDGIINTGLAANSPYNFVATGRSVIVNSSGELGYLVSTRQSKTNIESIKNVDFINQLNPVQFNYRKKDNILNIFTDELEENLTYGFIADEVEKVNKELVFYNKDNTLAGVEYNSMIAILTKAIQELNEKLVRNNIN